MGCFFYRRKSQCVNCHYWADNRCSGHQPTGISYNGNLCVKTSARLGNWDYIRIKYPEFTCCAPFPWLVQPWTYRTITIESRLSSSTGIDSVTLLLLLPGDQAKEDDWTRVRLDLLVNLLWLVYGYADSIRNLNQCFSSKIFNITMNSKSPLVASAIRTIEIEKEAVSALVSRIGDNFEQACSLILDCKGRVVVTGIGKSGHIGKKIVATFASTGTAAMYVHPAEASHGDIGMITSDDVVIAISNSGTTEEITALLPVLKRKGIALITLTGDVQSELAAAATCNLDVHVEEEACPLGLAPTSSTTATLVMGDAMAMALLEARGFTHDDFALSHPGGKLGRRLLVKVKDVMHSGKEIPKVTADTTLTSALLEMSEKGFGLTTVTDKSGGLLGVFSDGDLRRTIDAGNDIHKTQIKDVMSSNYKFIGSNSLAAEAAQIMQDTNVYVLIVKDNDGQIEGIVKMHDLLLANVV